MPKLDPNRLEPAYRVIRRFVDARKIPGAVALVGSSDQMLPPFAYGLTSWEPDAAPVTADTLYDCASLTKVVVTTTLTLRYVEEGRLHLDEPVARYVPEFLEGAVLDPPFDVTPFLPGARRAATSPKPARDRGELTAVPQPNALGRVTSREVREAVTLRHLLTHTSGLPAWRPLYQAGTSREELLKALCTTPLEAFPGTRVCYSCLGFILLGVALERIGGTRLDRLAQEQIFAPLAMADSMFAPPRELRRRIAPTERVNGRLIHGVVHDENARALGGVSGNAGLFATAPDLGRFAQMLLGRGQGAPRLLSAASIAAATRNYTAEISPEGRGLGWLLKGKAASPAGDLFGPGSFGHTGFTGTSIWIDPAADLFAVLLTNRVYPSRENQAHLDLRPLFHNALAAALT